MCINVFTDASTGITDNGIMILAGDAIEDFIGQKIALSTMASAA